ncbi:DUF58 domain-containing protein [Mumia sp. zg.B53]|uniref:DUF58 domain-containing protein n=1 Tax=Mumia sp. zg.B53 TaxID=2855449 RepID=UPI001C6EC4D7|nr:DUF58 domain-containing protein [Mumia sp. zg.B53]MBW9216635.1 DUF58 domain-containing protein [Mumia sp. zg.B53]
MRSTLGALTSRGRAFLAAGATVVLGGMFLGLDLLVRIGALALALPLLAVIAVAHSRSTVGASREVSPARVPAGTDVDVSLDLSGRGRGTSGTLLLEDRLPDALGGDRRFAVDTVGARWQCPARYRLVPRRRGFYSLGPLSVRVGDPFGFLSVRKTFHTTTPLVVTPTIHPLGRLWAGGVGTEQGEHRVRLGSNGRPDDASVREYRIGDDLRRIHWRTTARTGELMVRREEEGRHADVTVYLDTRRHVHRPGSDGSFEWAVSAAASVVAHFAGNGWDVRLITDTTDSHDSARDELGLILDDLAAVRMSARRGSDLVPADVMASRGTVVAIVGGADPDSLEHVNRCSLGAGRRLALVLDGDGWLRGAHGGSGTAADLASSARAQGWAATAVGGGDTVGEAWHALAAQSTKDAVR